MSRKPAGRAGLVENQELVPVLVKELKGFFQMLNEKNKLFQNKK